MTQSDPTRLTVEEAADLFQRSCEGRCGNPRCPSQHIDYAPDCVEFARATLRAALRVTDTPAPDLDRERLSDLQDAIIEAVRGQDGVGGIKAFAAYEDYIRGAPPCHRHPRRGDGPSTD